MFAVSMVLGVIRSWLALGVASAWVLGLWQDETIDVRWVSLCW